MLTAISASEFLFNLFLTSSGSIFKSSSLMSTILVVQSFHSGMVAVAINDIVGLITSIPFNPLAFITKSCPCEADVTATAYLAPTISANFCSNSATFGPFPHQPLSITSLSACTSSSPPSGLSTGNIVSLISIVFLLKYFYH